MEKSYMNRIAYLERFLALSVFLSFQDLLYLRSEARDAGCLDSFCTPYVAFSLKMRRLIKRILKKEGFLRGTPASPLAALYDSGIQTRTTLSKAMID
jgi:hypothetical protein